jgi:hypothetical protein
MAIGTRLRILLGRESRGALAPEPEGQIHMHCIPESTLDDLFRSSGMEVAAKAFSNSCELSFNGSIKITAERTYFAGYLSGLFAVRKSQHPG